MNIKLVGTQIAMLRKHKGITQSELGERLGVSFQAVSKWERGETLPDTAILPDLADVLETTVDCILSGGNVSKKFRGRIRVDQIAEGICCLKTMGEKLGRDNTIYRAAVEGINVRMNTDIEAAFTDERIFECFTAEAIIQNIIAGKYVDVTDVRNSLQHEPYRKIVQDYCERYGIK